MITIQEVKAKQAEWFSIKNKRFFGDVWYKVRQGKTSKKVYLVRLSSCWSDMLGENKTFVYRINNINPDLSIGGLLNIQFKTFDEVKTWLKEN